MTLESWRPPNLPSSSKFSNKSAGNDQCCFHEKWIKLFYIEILETKRETYFQIFELFPYLNIDVQPELANKNFNDEKESLGRSSKKCKRQQLKNEI